MIKTGPPPPQDLSVVQRLTNSLKIEFSPPYPPNGVITGYELIFWPVAHPNNIREIALTESQLEFEAVGLQPFTHYGFKVITKLIIRISYL